MTVGMFELFILSLYKEINVSKGYGKIKNLLGLKGVWLYAGAWYSQGAPLFSKCTLPSFLSPNLNVICSLLSPAPLELKQPRILQPDDSDGIDLNMTYDVTTPDDVAKRPTKVPSKKMRLDPPE